MQKVESAYRPPSVCFICTAAPSESVCDTLLDFNPGVVTPRNGRIYICEGCAQSAADALGLFDQHKERVDAAEAKVTEIEKKLVAYADIEKAIAVIAPEVAPAPAEEKTKKKKTAEKKTGADTKTLAPLTDPPPAE